MREVRRQDEAIIDKALLLVLMDLVGRRNESHLVGDRIKCMKLPFLATNQMFEKKAKGFNLTFFRDRYGPLSKAVYSAWNHLSMLGLVVEGRYGFRITSEGSALAQAIFNDLLSIQANTFFKQTIETVVLRYGHLSTSRIRQIVYDIEVSLPRSGVRTKVKDIEIGEDIILILEREEADLMLDIDSAWLETLAIELNPMNRQGLTKAFADYREGRILSHEEVWGNVPG